MNLRAYRRPDAAIHLLAAAVMLNACSFSNDGPIEITGQIEGNPIRAGSRVGGRVVEVLVDEGDRVSKGDVLIRLEDNEARALVAAAMAQVDQTKAQYEKLKAGARPEEIRQAAAAVAEADQHYRMALAGARDEEIAQARANLETAKANLDDATTSYARMESLLEGGGVSKQQRDAAFHAKEAAQGQFDAAREQLNLLVEGTRDEEIQMAKAALDLAEARLEELENGARREDIESARAAYELAKADLAKAEVALEEMTIEAPMDGVIESLDIHAGDLVAPQPILEMLDPEDLEVSVYVSAALLGQLQIGQPIQFTTDSHGDERFEGRIIHINNIGEFTPRNLQTQQDRVQQVFGVRLKLDSNGGKLRPGMTITARIPVQSGAP